MDAHSSQNTEEAGERRVLESEHLVWAEFAEATTVESFCQSWLAIQCRLIASVKGGAVLVRGDRDDATYNPVAMWPDVRRSMEHLSGAAQQSLTERRGVVLEATDERGVLSRYDVAYPVEVGDRLCAVAVLELGPQPEASLQEVLRHLHWGIAWLIDLFRRLHTEREHSLNLRVMSVLDLVAATAEAEGFQRAATAFATELAAVVGCDRVSVGFLKGSHVQVRALSHSAHFKQESNLLRQIGAAMDEAIDQEAAVVYPEIEGVGQPAVVRAALALCEQQRTDAVACIPFSVHGGWAGAVCLERNDGEGFDGAAIELCQATIALTGPILDAARLNDRPLALKAGDSVRWVAQKFFGAGHLAWKLAGGVVLAIVVFLSIATGDYRVTADAAAEGGVQTAIVAPFGGYVAEAAVRAGDIVEQGDLIALLNDRDLRLERLKWASQRDQVNRRLREAKASREFAQLRILEAQLGQTEAQLALVSENLKRTRITAPYRGVVITGDLSQSLGAPVERGEVLFEIAPLTDYRLVLKVDDRDVTQVSVGRTGTLTLSALVQQRFAFTVERITPVASAEEGRNFFRVEASLTVASGRLRPGMKGVAKIDIGERKLVWIWTHRMVDWLKLWLWSWLP